MRLGNRESRVGNRDFSNDNQNENLIGEFRQNQTAKNEIDQKNYEQAKIEFPLESSLIEIEKSEAVNRRTIFGKR